MGGIESNPARTLSHSFPASMEAFGDPAERIGSARSQSVAELGMREGVRLGERPLGEVKVSPANAKQNEGVSHLRKPNSPIKSLFKYCAFAVTAFVPKLVSLALSRPMREAVFGGQADRKDGGGALEHFQSRINAMPNARMVELPDRDGEVLRGHFFSPASSDSPGQPDLNKPVVLLLTGSCGSAQEQGYDLAKMYSEKHGVNVLCMNYRGFGDSDGGLPSRNQVYKDGHTMFNHLLDQGFKSGDVMIHGYSLGATVAAKLQQSAEKQGVPLKGVFYDRPMTSVRAAAKAHMGGGAAGWVAGVLGRWGVGRMSAKAKLDALPDDSKTPMLFSHDEGALGSNAKNLGDKMQARFADKCKGVIATNLEHLDNQGTAELYAGHSALGDMLRPKDGV